ncbi:type II toxin-antitoxin system HicB family antitoxin [Caballeronia sp. GAFFF2]|uniref:type II toxin-antitoxin system HicB family antitoxin n=1 Tax=Caballeronia sp. GAFFF2 TaxID=2921741 RepID=UPI0020281EE7|nr:type II toxin-antitoxin system HicB family antitoxin [Caballeronia sp. GAFFF2]
MNTTMTTPSEILSKPYARRIVRDESGAYTASILEFPGCLAYGDSASDALAELEKVAESWLTVALANGNPIREPFDSDGYSGKIALRLPRTLHRQVAEFAELEHTSINQLLVHAVSRYIGGAETIRNAASAMFFPIHINLANLGSLQNFRVTRKLPTAGTMIASPEALAPLTKTVTGVEVIHG